MRLNDCLKCKGVKFLFVGILVFFTAVYWSGYVWHVIGVLLILKGCMLLYFGKACGCLIDASTKNTSGKKSKRGNKKRR